MNLSAATTTTTVTFDGGLGADVLTIDGHHYDPLTAADAVAIARVSRQLGVLRALRQPHARRAAQGSRGTGRRGGRQRDGRRRAVAERRRDERRDNPCRS